MLDPTFWRQIFNLKGTTLRQMTSCTIKDTRRWVLGEGALRSDRPLKQTLDARVLFGCGRAISMWRDAFPCKLKVSWKGPFCSLAVPFG